MIEHRYPGSTRTRQDGLRLAFTPAALFLKDLTVVSSTASPTGLPKLLQKPKNSAKPKSQQRLAGYAELGITGQSLPGWVLGCEWSSAPPDDSLISPRRSECKGHPAPFRF